VPGATAARERLREFVKEPIYRYGKERDYPACDATSMLSAYLRNGTLSIRECFRAAMPLLPDPNVLKWLNELIWREFYGAISTHFPRVHEQAFRQEYENLPWRYSEEDLGKWKSGNTGFPIVDAAMRQLSEEGLMHNRLRMVVASFLTKDLRISWQEGERHFEANLLDLEPSSNNGGWQWAGSTGTDAAPYFRIFNPWRQSQRFDPQGTYIKRWLPPLRDLDPSSLHEPRAARPGFPEPMVDHRDARELALAMYKQATAG
jgi:deoxyribodipyrimidine photo-lyase